MKGREKNPFRLEFFRCLYTPECFSCSLAKLYLNAPFSEALKSVWLPWTLFGDVAVLRFWKPGSTICSGLYKAPFGEGKQPFAERDVRSVLSVHSTVRRLQGL